MVAIGDFNENFARGFKTQGTNEDGIVRLHLRYPQKIVKR